MINGLGINDYVQRECLQYLLDSLIHVNKF